MVGFNSANQPVRDRFHACHDTERWVFDTVAFCIEQLFPAADDIVAGSQNDPYICAVHFFGEQDFSFEGNSRIEKSAFFAQLVISRNGGVFRQRIQHTQIDVV